MTGGPFVVYLNVSVDKDVKSFSPIELGAFRLRPNYPRSPVKSRRGAVIELMCS